MTLSSRPAPRVGAQHMQTWNISSPRDSHWRHATCAEMCAEADDWRLQASFAADDVERARRLEMADKRDCLPHRCGWSTPVGIDSADEDEVKRYLTGAKDGQRRSALVLPGAGPGLVQYVFQPGQACFNLSAHRLPLERPEFFLRRRGDWRAHLGGTRQYDRPDQWVDDMSHNLDDWRRVQDGGPA